MRFRKFIYLLLTIFILQTSSIAFAQTTDSTEIILQNTENKVMDLQSCITIGVNNSTDILLLKTELKVRNLDREKSDFYNSKVKDGESKINKGYEQLNKLQTLYENVAGLPDNAPVSQFAGGALPAGTTKAGLRTIIQGAQTQLEDASTKLPEGLDKAQLEDLAGLKADMEGEVIRYTIEVAKRKIGVLIQKNYYEVLKNKRTMELKKKALERVKKQSELAKDGYSIGVKTLDDVYLAKMQEGLFEADLANTEKDYTNALEELKRSMGIAPEGKLEIEDKLETDAKDILQKTDTNDVLTRRVEIRKAKAEVYLNKLNLELTRRFYPETTFIYKEQALKLEKAEITLKIVEMDCKSEIEKSYNTYISMQKALDAVKEVIKNAEGNLEIAELRYNTGIEASTSNLKDLNLEEASGTMLDVLAAQEKLNMAEEKVTAIITGYNLAKNKYLLDIVSE